jgi:hypothetical protein
MLSVRSLAVIFCLIVPMSFAASAATPATPVFSTPGGTYQAYKSITISDATPGAAIYYTVTGVTPTVYSTQYTSPVNVNRAMTLKAIAVVSGSSSAVAAATYSFVEAGAPTFSEGTGTYQGGQTVTISDPTPGAKIYITVTGVTPTIYSQLYTGPVSVLGSMTLKAVAAVPGGPAGAVSTASYLIVPPSNPVQTPNSGASFFAMNVDHLTSGTPWPEVPVRTIRLWDTSTKWANLEASEGSYNWNNLDAQINMARANGSQVLYTFGGIPPWALPINVPIQSISRSNGVVTVTTSSPHGMYYDHTQPATNQSLITIAGVSDAAFDGTHYITSTPSANIFTYSQSGADTASSSGTMSAVCGGKYAPAACAEMPASITQWDDFVSQLISHVGPGAIQYWEFWNEANDPLYWLGNPATLVVMAEHARSIIRAVDPASVFLSPSFTGVYDTEAECAGSVEYCGTSWFDNWLALGGNSLIDVVAFHGYPTNGLVPEPLQSSVYQLKSVMSKHGNGSLPIWDTESSWRDNSNLPTTTAQAAWLSRQLLIEHSIGVQRNFWYAYDSPNWGTLWTVAGLDIPGYTYREMADWLTGATVTAPCAAEPTDQTTFVCEYSRADGYVARAVWNTQGSVSYSVPSQYTQYHDIFGNLHSVGDSVEISTAPILLENKSAF